MTRYVKPVGGADPMQLARAGLISESNSQKATLVGQVYYDIDKNGRYSPPPKGQDQPIKRKRIYLVDLGTRARAAPKALGSALTNAVGRFRMLIDQPSTVINGGIKLDILSNELIATLQIDAASNQKMIPLIQPVKVGYSQVSGIYGRMHSDSISFGQPVVTSPADTSNNVATVEGTGVVGQKIVLSCNRKDCGTKAISADGTFKVLSNKLKSGAYTFAVRLVNSQGLESDVVRAGSASILAAPAITESSQDKSTLAVKASGQAGSTAKIYNNGTLVGTAIVAADNTIVFPTIPLSLGANVISMTQEDASGVSDSVQVAIITVTKLESPVVSSTSVAGAVAIVTRTGQPGATVDLFSDGSKVGSVTVGADGTFSVSSSALAAGTRVLTVSQTFEGETSSAVSAGSVSVSTGGASTTTAIPAGSTIPAAGTTTPTTTQSQTSSTSSSTTSYTSSTSFTRSSTTSYNTSTFCECFSTIRFRALFAHSNYFCSFYLKAPLQFTTGPRFPFAHSAEAKAISG